MISRTHDLAAATALIAVASVVQVAPQHLSTLLFAVLANQIGGIAPDIDQPTAPLWRNLPIGGLVGKAFDRLLGGHRFLTHSLLGVGLFGFIVAEFLRFIGPLMPAVNLHLVWYAFIIGMLSHLVMDSLTKEGVPWLLPIPVKFGVPPLKKFRITTGKHVESLVVFPLLLIIIVTLCAQNYLVLEHIFQRS